MEFERRRRRHSHVEVTPLVDVVFNLLLFFIMTYNIVADPAIRIRLPESKTAESLAEEQIVITMTRDGNTFVGEQAVGLEEIPETVRQKLTEIRGPSVKIKADQEIPIGLLIKVVDGIRLAGCSAFSIVTERR
jgi:biopolymer transport protein ExbD